MRSRTFVFKLLLRKSRVPVMCSVCRLVGRCKARFADQGLRIHFSGSAESKKVYGSAVRLQGFTKDLTSAETNSIFASPQLTPSSLSSPNELHIATTSTRHVCHWPSGSPRLNHSTRGQSDRTALEVSEYERKQRRSVGISISQLHKER